MKIIGIDLGHGETAAALIDTENNEARLSDDLKLSTTGFQQKIMTALFISDDGKQVRIGDGILGAGGGQIYKGFKAAPDRLGRQKIGRYTKKELMQLYLRQLIETIYRLNPSKLNPDEAVKLIVGCPSDEDFLLRGRQLYEEILSDAAGQHVQIMSESRAAIIRANHEKGLEFSLSEGAVVLDFGSSTADSTYINTQGKRVTCLDRSKALGASFIEEELVRQMLEELGIEEEELMDRELSELYMRRQKERYFEEEVQAAMAGSSLIRPVTEHYFVRGEEEPREFTITQKKMEQVIKARNLIIASKNGSPEVTTWYRACEEFLLEVRNAVGENPLGCVILTGGASQMPFLRRLCAEMFAGRTIIEDNDASYCVSRGLALAGFTDYHSKKLLIQTKERIRRQIQERLLGYTSDLAQVYAEKCYSHLESRVKEWSAAEAEGKPELSLEEVCALVEQDFKADWESKDRAMTELSVFADWVDSLRGVIIEEVNQNFARNYPNSVQEIPPFEIDDDLWQRVLGELTGDETAPQVGKVLKNINVDNVAVNAGKAVLSLVGLVFSGVLSLIPGWGSKLAGKLSEEMDKFDMQFEKPLGKSRRSRAYSQVTSRREEIIGEQLQPEIRKALDEGLDKGAIADTIYQALEPLIQEAVDTVAMYFV